MHRPNPLIYFPANFPKHTCIKIIINISGVIYTLKILPTYTLLEHMGKNKSVKGKGLIAIHAKKSCMRNFNC